MVASFEKPDVQDEFPEGKFKDRKSLGDYLAVTRTICLLPVVISMAVINNTFAGSKRKKWREVLAETVMGHCYKSSTLRQLRILTLVKPLRVELNNIVYRYVASGLPNYNKLFEGSGFNARWISEIPDRTREDRVLLYLHGGGYALKMCQPQIQYICELAKILIPHRISVLALDYTITPFFRFPTQRDEGLACLKTLESQCDRVILMGDSCGGNLALSLLLAEDQIQPQSIWGLVLVSPWVDPGAQDGSMNSKLDILSKERLNEMTRNFVSCDLLDDPRVSPIKVDPLTWKRIIPRNTLVVWGTDECLADQCRQWVELAQIENYFVEPNGTHDCILRGITPEPCKYISRYLLQWSSEEPTPPEARKLKWTPYADEDKTETLSLSECKTTQSTIGGGK